MFQSLFAPRAQHSVSLQSNYSFKTQPDAPQTQQHLLKTPFLLQAINFFGLKDFLIDKMIFARRTPCTKFFNSEYRIGKNEKGLVFSFGKTQFKKLAGFSQQFTLIDMQDHFVPVIHIKFQSQSQSPEETEQTQQLTYISDQMIDQDSHSTDFSSRSTVIYSHGNSSDIEDSYNFVAQMAQIYDCDFIIYDYTGYTNAVGEPVNFDRKKHNLSENSISQDLIKVIEWSQIPQDKLILWGFSLGCYPTISVASQSNQLGGMILQSPFASIYRLLSDEVSYSKQFHNDIFANIELIDKVQSNILIMHSQDDEIVPCWHAQSLAKRCEFLGKPKFLKFIELKMFGHNNLDQVFYAKKANNLQKYIKMFMKRCSDQEDKFPKKGFQQFKENLLDNKQIYRKQTKCKYSKKTKKQTPMQVPELELKTQASIEFVQSKLLTTKRNKKLTLSRTFLKYNSKAILYKSIQIPPIKGDLEDSIDS